MYLTILICRMGPHAVEHSSRIPRGADVNGIERTGKACESGRYVCDSLQKVPTVRHLGDVITFILNMYIYIYIFFLLIKK